MSLFIGGLAFADPAMQDLVRIGVLGGSLLAAVGGYLVLRSQKTDARGEEPMATSTGPKVQL